MAFRFLNRNKKHSNFSQQAGLSKKSVKRIDRVIRVAAMKMVQLGYFLRSRRLKLQQKLSRVFG